MPSVPYLVSVLLLGQIRQGFGIVIEFVKTDWNGQSLLRDRTLVLTLLVGSGVFCFLFCLREQFFDMFFALLGGGGLAQPMVVEGLFIQVHTVLK